MNLSLFCRHFALIPFTLAFLCGITAGFHLPLADQWLWPAAVTTATGTAVLIALTRRAAPPSHLPLHLAAAAIGFLLVSEAVRMPAESNIFHLFPEKREAVVVGTMAEMAKRGERTSAAVIICEGVAFAGEESRGFMAVTGKALVRLEGDWPQQIAPGDRMLVRASFKRPQGSRTRGTFDYPFHLAVEGITVTGFARSPLFFARLPNAPKGGAATLFHHAERLRSHLAEAIDNALPQQNAALFRALLLGDRSGVPPPLLDAFKGAGILHLFAISGLHLGVIATLLYLLCYHLLSRSENLLLFTPVHLAAVCATLPPLLFYAVLTGLNPPVLRALAMVFVVAFAVTLRRITSPSTLVAAAALLLLFFNPLRLFTASFQLSFTAVWAIFMLLPLIRPLVKKRTSLLATVVCRTAAALLISIGITLCTAPLTIFHFQRFSPIGPVVNLLVEPLLCILALPLAMTALPFLLLAPSLGQLLLEAASVPLEAGVQLAQWAAALPGASLRLSAATPWFGGGCLLFYCALGLLCSGTFVTRWGAAGNRAGRLSAPLLPGLLVLALTPLFFFHGGPETGRIVFIDVGQGSSTLVQTADGFRVLVDGGGGFFTRNLGERSIAPCLWSSGISHLDAIVATHSDRDHTGAIPFLVRTFKPKVLYLRDIDEDDRAVTRMRQAAAETGCRVRTPESGEQLVPGVTCLYNFGAPQHKKGGRWEKNRGLVLLAEFAGMRLLLPGDIDHNAEHELLAKRDLPADTLLLAAHHGSKSSNSAALLDRLTPQAVFVSCGDRPGVFPATRLVKELAQRHIPLFATDSFGTLELTAEKNSWGIFHLMRPDNNPFRPLVRCRIGTIKNGGPGQENRR